MSGVDRVIQLGVADGERLGITGWSNGGLVASWVITQTTRFKVAIVGAGFPDLIGVSATNPYISYDLAAEPWDNLRAYTEYAPLFHMASVTTPTLILHGEQDAAVPIGQAYGLYTALKRRGIPVKMVVYPRGSHVPQEPKQALDIARRHLEWMDQYLRKKESANK